jgi:hypothetical protein
MPKIKSIHRQLATWQIIETSPYASRNVIKTVGAPTSRKLPISPVYRALLFRADYQRGMFVALLATALYESWRQNHFAVLSLRIALCGCGFTS